MEKDSDYINNNVSCPLPNDIGQEFVRQYYAKWSSQLRDVIQFYGNDSYFLHDGHEAKGQEDIQNTIDNLNYENCKAEIHSITDVYHVSDSLVLQVCGQLSINDALPRKFLQNLVLRKQMAKKYYAQKDIFQWLDKAFCADLGNSVKSAVNETTNKARNEENDVELISAPQRNGNLPTVGTANRRSQQTDLSSNLAPEPITQNNDTSDQNKENDYQIFDTSFDEADFNIQPRVDNNLPYPTQSSSFQLNLQYEDALKQVRYAVESLKKQRMITFSTRLCNIVATTKGRFFDTVCQVVGVLYSTNEPIERLHSRVHLRVVDGTLPTFSKSPLYLPDHEWDQPKCRVDTKLHDILREATVDIVCYDEFQDIAEACNPGDIIYVKNFRAHELESVVSIKVNGNGSAFKRGISILKKANPNVTQPASLPPRASDSTTVIVIHDDEDIKFPINESVMGSPTNKRARIGDDSFVTESPQH